MEIIKINNKKLKIILHNEDLKRYNLTITSYLAIKTENNIMLLDILSYINENNILKIENNFIYLDSFLINKNKLIVFINIFNKISTNNYIVNKKNNILELNYYNFIICEFSDINIFFDFLELLKFYFYKNNLNYFFIFFELYEYKSSYYLIINNINLFFEYFKLIYFNILEFTKKIYFSDVFLQKIYEYGKKINKNNYFY